MYSVIKRLGHLLSRDFVKISIFIMAFLLPFQTILNVWILMILIIYGIFMISLKKLKIPDFRVHDSFNLVVLYLLYAAGMIYTSEIAEGLVQLRIKLPMLIFPVLFLLPGSRSLKFSDILQFFVAGCLMAFIICLLLALSNSLSIIDGKITFRAITYAAGENLFLDSIKRNSNYFFGNYLSYFMHPSYFSMYLAFGFVGLLEIRRSNRNLIWFRSKLVFYLSLFLILIAVIMLTSKAGILILFLLIGAWLFFRGSLKLGFAGRILSLLLISIVFILLVKINPRFQTSISKLKEYRSDPSSYQFKESTESTAVRLLIWQQAVSLSRENFLIGMGTGDVKAGLTDRYELHHISGAFDKQYNSHNQYLETLLALGMIGLVMLLLTFIFPVLTLKSDIKPVFMFFLLLVGLNFQVESMLNRQAGVMFFAFFYSFLSVNNSSNSGRRGENLIKFCFDRFFALIGLILLLVPGLIIGCLIKSNSNGPVFYTQIRIGFKGKQFRMIKFRTMHPNEGSSVSVSTDPRITPFGRILRRWKLDELPELWNIFTGEMSFVGPRPDVPGFADKLEGEERKILLLRPGLTGPASIKYSNEEYILSKVKNPEEYNLNVIWPDKVKINLDYYHKHNLWIDITYIMQTFISKSEKIE